MIKYIYRDKTLTADELDGSKGLVIDTGSSGPARLPDVVSAAGDLNGDGVDDIVIGNVVENPYGFDFGEPGSATIYYGSDQGSADATADVVVEGVIRQGQLGATVAPVGDINADGFDDILIGAPSIGTGAAGQNDTGKCYVVYGTDQGLNPSISVSDLNGSNGFVINGIGKTILGNSNIYGDRTCATASTAGDFNADGIDDLIVGVPDAPGRGSLSFIVFGNDEGFGASFDLANINNSNRVRITGGYSKGLAVSYAGDVNDDGIDDVIISSSFKYTGSNPYVRDGEAYVVFGTSQPAPRIDLADLDGSNGFTINGREGFQNMGRVVSSAGDVNGDGIDDVMVNAGGAFQSGAGPYGIFVIYGRSDGFDATIDLDNLDGSNGFQIGLPGNLRYGTRISSAGDVSGDGIDDLIIGTSFSNEAHIIFGNDQGFPAFFDATTLNGGNGFSFNAEGSVASVSSAGDFNSDGINDLLIADTSRSYVVYGGNFTGSYTFQASAEQERFHAEQGPDTYIFTPGTTTTSSTDLIKNFGIEDTIDLSALGLTAEAIEFRELSGGTSVKLIDSFAADAFQLKVELNGLSASQLQSRIVWQGGGSGPSGPAVNSINGTAGNDRILGTPDDDIVNLGDGDDIYVGWTGNDVINGGPAEDYDQVNYNELSTALVFSRNADGSVNVQKPAGGNDTLINIDGIWFDGDTQWFSVNRLVERDANNTGGPGTTGSVITATADTETHRGTSAADTFVFANNTTFVGAIDTIAGFGTEDSIDLSALGFSPANIEFREVGGGSILKLIDGFTPGSFQLRVELNGISAQQVQQAVVWGGTSNPGGSNVITASTAGIETYRGTPAADTFVFAEDSSYIGKMHTLEDLGLEDTIDLSALELNPATVELRDIGGGVVKIIEGFGNGDFQVRIKTNGLSVEQLRSLIDWGSGAQASAHIVAPSYAMLDAHLLEFYGEALVF